MDQEYDSIMLDLETMGTGPNAAEQGGGKPEGTEPIHHAVEDSRRQITCLMSALAVIRSDRKVV